MTRLLVATTNPHKLREIRDLLADARVEPVGLDVLARIAEPEETGESFDQNARLKALYYDGQVETRRRRQAGDASDAPTYDVIVAEDSGLVVDALDGEPGVHSARFLRPDATYPERFAEILRRLKAHADRPRTARFVCALAVAREGRIVYEARGAIEGEIAREPRGTAGFGYDPIFFYPPYGCTLAEVTQAAKLRVAHRGQAFRALAAWLERDDTKRWVGLRG